jgi:hypothetical protein
MGMSREVIEQQLEVAQRDRESRAKELSQRGLTDKQFRTDPKWRQHHARYRQLKSRLARVAELEQMRAAAAGSEADE